MKITIFLIPGRSLINRSTDDSKRLLNFIISIGTFAGETSQVKKMVLLLFLLLF